MKPAKNSKKPTAKAPEPTVKAPVKSAAPAAKAEAKPAAAVASKTKATEPLSKPAPAVPAKPVAAASSKSAPAVVSKSAPAALAKVPAKSVPAKPVEPVAVPTKNLAKQRVKISVPVSKGRAVASKKTVKPAAAASAKPAATERKPARVAAKKSSKPGAQRQIIKITKPRARKAAPAIPPLLLEGDQPSAAPASGPGQRYALGATPPPEHTAGIEELGELPEAYGTQRLLLTARDPHWLYAHWDFTRAQLKKYNARSADRHLVLRVYQDHVAGEPIEQAHVHPESRHWFIHVGRGGARYVAELGYYNKKAKWNSISVSKATLTPPDSLSEDTTVRFANMPVDVPFEQLMVLVRAAVRENVPLAEAILELRAAGHRALPDAATLGTTATSPTTVPTKGATAAGPASAPQWTAQQEKALAEIVTMDSVRRVWMGSLEITELVKRQLVREITTGLAAQMGEQFGLVSSPLGAVSSVSSAFGGEVPGQPKDFWFNVNAELIIYGATERDAEVTIGGRVIKLRPDGSFSYRFALPDGNYELPCIAIAADKSDGRAAELKFSRATQYFGDVGTHPQDAALKPPLAENVV